MDTDVKSGLTMGRIHDQGGLYPLIGIRGIPVHWDFFADTHLYQVPYMHSLLC
jgi:hypothetical protein